MEFSIDIHTKLCGEILIEDFSKEYGQYFEEDLEILTSYDYYKYSESVTLNILSKINVNNSKLLKVKINDHTEYVDSSLFKINEDGYYIIDHIILPNLKWYENASEEYKEYYETIYYVDNGIIYKKTSEGVVECSVNEILERNVEGTTIKKCKVDVFFNGNLQQCYINYCKQVFDTLLGSCNKESADIFARDFIWMTLNIIDYLIGFKQYKEAQRLIELFNTCGGFCKSSNNKSISSCGCH